eukprot:755468-Pelagomonas_calceolata.AAC.3
MLAQVFVCRCASFCDASCQQVVAPRTASQALSVFTCCCASFCDALCEQVIAGSDKGVTGTITEVLPKLGQIKIEGVNIKTKHLAPQNQNEQTNGDATELVDLSHGEWAFKSACRCAMQKGCSDVELGGKMGGGGCGHIKGKAPGEVGGLARHGMRLSQHARLGSKAFHSPKQHSA